MPRDGRYPENVWNNFQGMSRDGRYPENVWNNFQGVSRDGWYPENVWNNFQGMSKALAGWPMVDTVGNGVSGWVVS